MIAGLERTSHAISVSLGSSWPLHVRLVAGCWEGNVKCVTSDLEQVAVTGNGAAALLEMSVAAQLRILMS